MVKRVFLAVTFVWLALSVTAHAQIIMMPPPYPRTLETSTYDGIHTVSVLSGIGSNFDLVNSNSLFPSERAIDISSWRINEIIEATLKRYLGGRFRFVATPYDLSRMASIGSQTWSSGRFQDFIKTVPNEGIDAFIVLRPNTQGRIGLERRHQQNLLEVFYEMEVVDAHSYRILARADGWLNGSLPIDDTLGDDYALQHDLVISDDKIALLRPRVIDLLKLSLVETIGALQFGVALPRSGDGSILDPVGPEIPSSPTR